MTQKHLQPIHSNKQLHIILFLIYGSTWGLQSSTWQFPLSSLNTTLLVFRFKSNNASKWGWRLEVSQEWFDMFAATILETTVHSGRLNSTSTWVHYQAETLHDRRPGSPSICRLGQDIMCLNGLSIKCSIILKCRVIVDQMQFILYVSDTVHLYRPHVTRNGCIHNYS